MAEMNSYKGTVSDLEKEIKALEAHLVYLKAELLEAKKTTAECGGCRIEYNNKSRTWNLSIRTYVPTLKESMRFISVFESRNRQETVDAVGSLAANLFELQLMASVQAENRKEEEAEKDEE